VKGREDESEFFSFRRIVNQSSGLSLFFFSPFLLLVVVVGLVKKSLGLHHQFFYGKVNRACLLRFLSCSKEVLDSCI